MLYNKSEQIAQLKEMLKNGEKQYNMMVDDYEGKVNDLIGALKRARDKQAELQKEIDRLHELLNRDEMVQDDMSGVIKNKNEQIDQLKRHIDVAADERNTVVSDMNDKLREGYQAMQAMKARYEKKLAEKEAQIAKLRTDVEERDDLIDKGKDMLYNKSEQIAQLKEVLRNGEKRYNMMVDDYEGKVNDLIGALKRARDKQAELQKEIDRLHELLNRDEMVQDDMSGVIKNKKEKVPTAWPLV
eukprot:TRINITY_DN148_c0_g3_i2.p1 TRINITY_DN148_c0_g3~~TRINITY_DN148_c0_g3_i2.p1  ORF type:complete len:258 (-),score=111.44 TRINITY_DN148_c0_g3_i2:27-755(-)